jgi:hypothetical protein
MTLEQIKKEAETLSSPEKAHLAAYLIHLRNREDPDYLREMRDRIDDREKSHWLSPDEFERRLDAKN